MNEDLPAAEAVLADFELTRGLTIQIALLSLLGFLVALGAFSSLYVVVTGQLPSFQFAPGGVVWWTDALNALMVVVLALIIILPHEWIHGLAIRYYGGTPSYGVGLAYFVLPFAYATTVHRFTRNQYIVVLLAPLVGMTVVGVLVMVIFEWGWLILPLAANASGAVGDIWMALTLLGFPSRVSVEDHKSGFKIFGQDSERPRGVSVTTVVWDGLAGTAITSIGMLALLAIGAPIILAAFGVESLTIGAPGTITYLFSYSTVEGLSVGVGPGLLVIGALIGLTYSLVRTYMRGGTGRET